MGRSDRWCAALRKPNGLVSSDCLEGHAVVDGPHGPTGLECGAGGSALGQFLERRLRQEWVFRYGAVACLLT